MIAPVPQLDAQDKKAVQEFQQQVRAEYGKHVVEIKLFGSRAKGTAAADADIDLLVLVANYSSKLEDDIIDLAFEANLKYDVYISPRVIGQETLRHPIWSTTHFVQSIQREGLQV